MEKMYAMSHGAQEELITKYCFGECGKVHLGAVEIMGGGFVMCSTQKEDCPGFEKEMDEPVGEIEGTHVHIRKLR